MNEMIPAAILMLCIAFGIVPIFLTFRFRGQLDALLRASVIPPEAMVAVIIPCKGIDQGFQENIQSFLAQENLLMQLVFVVATADDPAYPELLRLVEKHAGNSHSRVTASVHVAGIENRRAQKLTNQLHGLTHVLPEVKYLVFLDSDIRPDPGFVGRLVSPLQDTSIAATTGFRWYHPPVPTLGSMLRSTWNAGALPLLTNPGTIFAFGGAMAMTRADFDKAEIAKAWDTALSDDFPFTLGVKKLGKELRFVPSCIAVSFESSTLAETVEFTNRQSIISRIYFPPLWWAAALGHSLANLFVVCGLYGLVQLLVGGGLSALLLAGCLLLIPLQCLNAVVMLDAVPLLLPQLREQFSKLRKYYVGCAPLASILSLINTLYSMTTRQIVWRGIRYELVSTTETRVL